MFRWGNKHHAASARGCWWRTLMSSRFLFELTMFPTLCKQIIKGCRRLINAVFCQSVPIIVNQWLFVLRRLAHLPTRTSYTNLSLDWEVTTRSQHQTQLSQSFNHMWMFVFVCLLFFFFKVDCMEEALQRSQANAHAPDLKVSILLDYTRGSRGWFFPVTSLSPVGTQHSTRRPDCTLCFSRAGQINSRTMLLPLLQRFTSQMRVSLYHTPDLRGLLRLLVPQRFNETIGVQHIKVYLFDDSIIISGCVDSGCLTSCQYGRFHTVCLSSNSSPPSPRPGAALPTCLILFWSTQCLHKAFLIRVQVFVPTAGKCFSAYTSGCAPKSMCTVHLVQHTKWNLMLTLSLINSFWVNKTTCS